MVTVNNNTNNMLYLHIIILCCCCQVHFRTEVKIMSNCNQDIRALAKDRGVKLWEIAEVIGVSDGNFSRRLRRELSPAEKQRIVKIIDRVAAQHAAQP